MRNDIFLKRLGILILPIKMLPSWRNRTEVQVSSHWDTIHMFFKKLGADRQKQDRAIYPCYSMDITIQIVCSEVSFQTIIRYMHCWKQDLCQESWQLYAHVSYLKCAMKIIIEEGEIRSPCALPIAMYNGAATVKNSMASSQNSVIAGSSNSPAGYLPRRSTNRTRISAHLCSQYDHSH